MEKKLIVRIAEGLGNQLFMYANAYSIARDLGYDLLIDSKSGYFKKKNQKRKFELDKFNINISYADEKFIYDSNIKDLKRKFLKNLNFFFRKKKYIVEKKNKSKQTKFINYSNSNFDNIIYVEGHFESEKFFKKYSNDIIKQFTLNDASISKVNPYINKISNSNSISICIRQNRYSEGRNKDFNKSELLTKKTIDYIYRGIKYFENKVENPTFFIWSNNFDGLDKYFDKSKFVFVENSKNKSINDFYLFKYCQHFIVGPTSFHWWGAWLNNNKNKICVRPKDINVSNNADLWPENWISV